jgi:transposase-like protein
MRRSAPVVKIAGTDAANVEVGLRAGMLECPNCSGVLRPWGRGAERVSRTLVGEIRQQLRRSRCSTCCRTHLLLPSNLLIHCLDEVEVIGQALTMAGSGSGHRRIAAHLDLPSATVRGWLRRVRQRAEEIRALPAR